MPSKLCKLVKCTCTVHDSDIVAIPAGFTDIGVDNAPSSANFACHNFFVYNFLIISGGSQEFAAGNS